MRISLISPFRTLLNVDTDMAFARAPAFSKLLEKVVATNPGQDGVTYKTRLAPPPERPFTKYRHLDQDHATWFTMPLARATLSEAIVSDMEKFAERAELRQLRDVQRPILATVDIHDNTLAVLHFELDFDDAKLTEAFDNPADLETYLSDYAAACARFCESAVIQPFIEAFDRACHSDPDFTDAAKLLRRPKQFLAFNDLEHHRWPVWDEADEPSLWTHRIYQTETINKRYRKDLAPLLRLPDAASPYRVGQGTTWLAKTEVAARMRGINATCQYFYCMLDALNLSQKRLLRKITDREARFNIDDAYARYDRLENLLSEMKNELLDYTTALQGEARDMFDAIQTAFRTHELVAAMEQRSDLLRGKIDRAQARRSLLQQRLLTFSLVLLGAIQIVSLVMQVFNYPNEDFNNDRVPGLFDLVSRIPFDLAMNIVLIGIVVFGLIWSWRTRRPSGR